MEKSLRWFKMRTVKNYVGIILCACVIIFIYKTFDISLFSNIFYNHWFINLKCF